MAVADGHGSASSPCSSTGSRIAVNVFHRVMAQLYSEHQGDWQLVYRFLAAEGSQWAARRIDDEWKKRVLAASRRGEVRTAARSERETRSATYRRYGTTLLGLLVTPSFVFAYQLGDGDIVVIAKQGPESLITGTKILGVETYSLCADESSRYAVTALRARDESSIGRHAYALATDGFANSFESDESFLSACQAYYDAIQEHGWKAVSRNLKRWLWETSEHGSGDDVTMLWALYEEEGASVHD